MANKNNNRSYFLEELFLSKRTVFLRYAVSLGIISITLVLTGVLEKFQLGHLYSINLAAVVLSAMYGGLGPAILVSIVGVACMDYFYVYPLNSIELHNPVNILRIIVFTGVAILVSWLVASLKHFYQRSDSLKKREEHARLAREEILAVVAHDLRSPASGIRLSAQVMKMCIDGDKSIKTMKNLTESIFESADQMNRLIDDLLDAWKMDCGKFSVVKMETQPDSVIKEITQTFKPHAEEKRISLVQKIEPGTKKILSDRKRLSQALGNLLNNSLKFTPEKGTIEIGAKNEGAEVRFYVKDTGPGISEDKLPHIFERNWQSKEHAPHGTGLGLYIVKGIVEAHEGTVEVESKIGQGSTFFLFFPAAG